MVKEFQLAFGESLRETSLEEDLLRGLSDTENAFIERKTISDTKGWLHTVVAFANSCPEGFPGLLYIGVDNKGNIQKHAADTNFEELQKTLGRTVSAAYPVPYYFPKTITKDGHTCLVVMVPGSPNKPHFTGKAFVRVGPETRESSEEQFENLIAERGSVVRVIRGLIGQQVFTRVTGVIERAVVVDCNEHFATFRHGVHPHCYPVSKITINFEPAEKLHLIEIG